MKSLTIGQLARRAGVGVETVRFYERKGLLEEPSRRPSGYRQYDEGVVDRLRFIRRGKELGFTLGEIKELLSLRLDAESNVRRRERTGGRENHRHRGEDALAAPHEKGAGEAHRIVQRARAGGRLPDPRSPRSQGTKTMSSDKPRSGWRGVLATAPALGLSLLPHVTCPAC